MQDTGGQPIFLSILELLTTPGGTVYLVVFNLLKVSRHPSRPSNCHSPPLSR